MNENINNKEFWDNYVTYWENKIEEANNDNDAKDKTAGDLIFEQYMEKMNVDVNDKVLDFGCGFGRLYPIYKRCINSTKNDGGYYGIDVSPLALARAEKKYTDLKVSESLIEYDGLNIPFPDGFFDKVMCWGVFDTCYQKETIREIFRVMKPNGILMINGKNNEYYTDDEDALIAEVNARKKGHPNSFTDVHKLVGLLEERGIEICDQYYYVRRKDFSIDKYEKEIPSVFYQWTLILKKSERYNDKEFPIFCDAYSNTYLKIGKK